jgi:hypothetical protein
LELTNEAVGDIKSPIFSRILYRRAEFSIGFTDKQISSTCLYKKNGIRTYIRYREKI